MIHYSIFKYIARKSVMRVFHIHRYDTLTVCNVGVLTLYLCKVLHSKCNICCRYLGQDPRHHQMSLSE